MYDIKIRPIIYLYKKKIKIYMMDASLKQISSYKAIKYNIVSCLIV